MGRNGQDGEGARTSTPREKLVLVRAMLRPYRNWLLVILAAMLVETAMTLAAPWPLKIVLDSVVGSHKAPEWMGRFLSDHGDKLQVAAAAALMVVAIAVVNAIASYIDDYHTESVSQWVAHDLRMRLCDHLQSLSLRYYDTHRSGSLLSTITADVKTIQGFASSGTLGILVDLLSIVGMLGVMLWLDWDFALVAVAVTPFLLLFVARFNGVVKRATHEVRRYQSDIVSVTEEGLESMRSAAAAPQPAGHRRGSSAGTGHGACTRTTRSSTARCW
jgi:subfamily B ATP-binding cassette protein MsbA